jgi:hypothetical protein
MGIYYPAEPPIEEDAPWWRDILEAGVEAGTRIIRGIPDYSLPTYTPPYLPPGSTVEYPVPDIRNFRTTDWTVPVLAGMALLFFAGKKRR